MSGNSAHARTGLPSPRGRPGNEATSAGTGQVQRMNSLCSGWNKNVVDVVVVPRGARQLHNKQSNINQDNIFFKGKSCPGWDSNTRHCLLDRVLFLLSYQGSSAGRALSLQHNTTHGKVKPQYYQSFRAQSGGFIAEEHDFLLALS